MYKYFKTFKNPEIWDNYAFKSRSSISWKREKVAKNLKLIMAYFEQYIVAQLTSNFLCSIIQAKMEIKIIRENGLDIECSFKLSEWYWMFLVFKSIFNVIFVYIEFKKKKIQKCWKLNLLFWQWRNCEKCLRLLYHFLSSKNLSLYSWDNCVP